MATGWISAETEPGAGGGGRIMASVYGAQSVLTLMSRAWNLCRLNLKKVVVIMLGPVLLSGFNSLLLSLLSSRNVLTPTSVTDWGFMLLVGLAAVLLFIPTLVYWGLSYGVLSRFFYSAIVSPEPLRVQDCWRYVRRIGVSFGATAVMVGLLSLVMMGLVFAIFIAGLALGSVTLAGLATALGPTQGWVQPMILIFFMLVLGFVVLTISMTLLAAQMFMFAFPLMALCTAPRPTVRIGDALGRAYRLLLAHLPRLIVLAIALFLFVMVLTTVLTGPVWIWAGLEMMRLGVSEQHHAPFYVQALINLWTSLTSLVIVPFQVGALTLCWYDCQVRSEGLDLQLWLNQLLVRRGLEPEAFHTVVSPQPG